MNITGLDKLTDALQQYAENVEQGVKEAIANAAEDIVEAAKKNNSAMGGSVTITMGSDGMSAIISADDPDAIAAEYGTKPGKHKPFLNSAFEECKPVLLDNITKTLEG